MCLPYLGMMQQSPVHDFEATFLQAALRKRRDIGSLRKLSHEPDDDSPAASHQRRRQQRIIDFSSNDYLGLAQSRVQHQLVDQAYAKTCQEEQLLGATGSRLLTGDSTYAHQLERKLAKLHRRPSALLCNSGYDANLAVLSSLTQYGTLVLDQLCHNSIFMGLKLGGKTGKPVTFRHNNLSDLKRILQQYSSTKVPLIIVVESVYSMDGDIAPLDKILDLAKQFSAVVVVDEAHGLGILGQHGMGLLEEFQLENHPALLCSIHTFGKAAGCHGAVVCGSDTMKEFLINFARPVIYSTFLPLHSLVCISCAYDTMSNNAGMQLRKQCFETVKYFRSEMNRFLENERHTVDRSIRLTDSATPIQALLIPGNKECTAFCERLWKESQHQIRLYPIRSPTVPKGQERVRIVLHSHNTIEQVQELIRLVKIVLLHKGSVDLVNLRSKL
jgi:8-amino-7-oxononanoate synthase